MRLNPAREKDLKGFQVVAGSGDVRVQCRLTRMMTKAMEVCGTQGSFEKTCIITMAVLREEKVSVMAMLEAFVFDPLINWRLLQSRPAQARPPHSKILNISVQVAQYE